MKVREGMKYLLDEDETYNVPSWFPIQFRYDSCGTDYVDFSQEFLKVKRGFAWNGANGFPDFKWVMVPSKIHDAMLWVLHYNSHKFNYGTNEWDRDYDLMDPTTYREMKRAIDQWFADECKARLPRWARVTPFIMFIAVNRASKFVPGKDQAEAHEVVEYV